MSHTKPPFVISQEMTRAFLIRLTWDGLSEQWHILLKPVNGADAILFSDLESTLLYLETVMREQRGPADQRQRENTE